MAMLHALNTVNDIKMLYVCHLTTMAACPASGIPECVPAVPD